MVSSGSAITNMVCLGAYRYRGPNMAQAILLTEEESYSAIPWRAWCPRRNAITDSPAATQALRLIGLFSTQLRSTVDLLHAFVQQACALRDSGFWTGMLRTTKKGG